MSLWPCVATAASTLTISVSMAWASGISTHPGKRTSSFLLIVHHGFKQQTPYLAHTGTLPGDESRLAQVLKAYHVDKTRDPIDLPEWRFEKHESRRAAAASTLSVGDRGPRDVYDTAAITS